MTGDPAHLPGRPFEASLDRPPRVPRMFLSAGRPQVRRVADAVLLVAATAALVVLGSVAQPPGQSERALIELLSTLPGWLTGLWEFLYDLLAAWALVVLAAAAFARRSLALHAVSAAVLAAATGVVTTRLVSGSWPELHGVLIGGAQDFPALRVAVSAAVIVALAPDQARRGARIGGWLILLGVISVMTLGLATPSGALASVLIAAAAAAAVRLAFGTSAGAATTDEVRDGLQDIGCTVGELEFDRTQVAGVYQLRGRDDADRPLAVRVYGREAYGSQLLVRSWSNFWYRDREAGPTGGPRQRAEHEALLTVLAGRAGVLSRDVVTVGSTADGDALLVLADDDRARAFGNGESGLIDDVTLARCWSALEALHAAGIANLQLDLTTVTVLGGEVRLDGLSVAVTGPRREHLLTDRSQMLALTAAVVGSSRAVDSAAEALGTEGIELLLPYLQPVAFGATLRQTLKSAEIDVDALRSSAADRVGADAPDLVPLRRITLGTVIQTLLLLLAASALISGLSGFDFAQVHEELTTADWSWLWLGFIVVQLPRLFQAVATLGTVPKPLPFVPVWAMQLATGFMNLALPSSLARMSVNVRFFQRQGIPPTTSITSGVIDSFAGNAVQVAMLALLLLFSGSDLNLSLDVQTDGGASRLLVLLIVAALGTIAAAIAVGRVRRAITSRVQRWWPDVRAAIQALRASHKLAQVVGGNVAAEVLFATALGMFARGFGYQIDLADLLVINLSVSLFASLIPVPGGIGVVEAGLVVGLTAAGLNEDVALAVAICYRLASFYIPPTWGWFAMRWLKQNRYL